MLENTLDDNGISVVNGKTDVLPVDNSAVNGKSDASEGISKDLFDANFLQNFSFSPTLTLNNLTDNLNCYNKPKSLDEPLIPTEHILGYFKSLRSSNLCIMGISLQLLPLK